MLSPQSYEASGLDGDRPVLCQTDVSEPLPTLAFDHFDLFEFPLTSQQIQADML